MLLKPPLRSLSRYLAPQKIVVDCGGHGQCGPNVVAFLLPFVDKIATDGIQLRAIVASHAARPDVHTKQTHIRRSNNSCYTMAEFIINCMEQWPLHQQTREQPSVSAWCAAMVRPQSWVDAAFLQVVADLFHLAIHVTSVDDLGIINELGHLLPCPPTQPTAVIEIGSWENNHFVAIAALLPQAAAQPISTVLHRQRILRTPVEVTEMLRQPCPPSVLVAFEFSSSMSSALLSQGFEVLSCDFRLPSLATLRHYHYLGDVRDVVHLQHWERAYFFPPCFQQLRADVTCLPSKIADGRAYWGCALVLWCLACPYADLVVVEQPDTIVYDGLDLPPGVHLHQFRTTWFGDAQDKFVRLATRNATLPPFPSPGLPAVPQPRRSQFDYVGAEARDRERSTWSPYPNTCLALANAAPLQEQALPLSYAWLICLFATVWVNLDRPLPADYDTPDAQPTSTTRRAYQKRRGPADAAFALSADTSVRHPYRDVEEESNGGALSGDDDEPIEEESNGGALSGDDDEPIWELSSSGGTSDAKWSEGDPSELRGGEAAPITQGDETGFALSDTKMPIVSLREAVPPEQSLALVVCICVLLQPLVLIHANGFSITGFYAPASTRSAVMRAVQNLCDSLFTITHTAFMVGQYSNSFRVFSVPVDFHPRAELVVRSPAERMLRLAKGAALVWCTLAALQGCEVYDVAARSVLAASAYVAPVSSTLPTSSSQPAVLFASGRMQERSVLRRALDDPVSRPAQAAFAQMSEADSILREFVLQTAETGDDWLTEWAERIVSFDVSLIPPDILSSLPSFSDSSLDDIRLSAIPAPYTTAWVPLPPRQQALPPDAPACVESVAQLLLPESHRRLQAWLNATQNDLLLINTSLARGVPPGSIVRARREAIAIGQDELHHWAQGRVWDCTKRHSRCCCLLDFQEKPSSHLDLAYLRGQLEFYADQALVSHLVEGVKLEADVELHTVLVPHLSSLPMGFHSVDKELRRMHSMRWYSFHSDLPFWPLYLNGQGAAPRKLEADRFRRTLEGGGPRQPTLDRSGLTAVSLNEASRVYHMPRHFHSDHRPEFIAWLNQRGLPPLRREPLPTDGLEPPQRLSKWPKERKPQLSSVMRDISVLRRAAEVLGEPAYSFGDDAKDYFNQLAMAPCEFHKLGVTFLAQGSEAVGVKAGDLFFITEKQLPFGLHPASNVAQRFSDALLDIFRAELDQAEWELNRAASPRKTEWLTRRLALQSRLGEPCVPIRARFQNSSEKVPDIPAPLRIQDIPEGYVCPQLRLYSAYMFTDDPQFIVVSPQLTVAALRKWRDVTTRLGLLMAIPEKRSLGSWSRWIGVYIVVGLGLIVVPKDKILKASVAITTVLQNQADFRLYRALCGLLEHLRAVNLRAGNVMFGLYQPHSRDGASRFGPAARVICSALMRQQLGRWQALLARSCAVSVKRALLRCELESEPRITIEASSDACLGDDDPPGFGGFCHGLFWQVPVKENDIPFVTIPVLELMGALANVMVLFPYVKGMATADRSGLILRLRTDALATAYGLADASLTSTIMASVYLKAMDSDAWGQLQPLIRVEHVFGDANPLADAVSRQHWSKLSRLCTQLGIKAQRLEPPAEVIDLYNYAVQQGKLARRVRPATAGDLSKTTGGGEATPLQLAESDAVLLDKLRQGTSAPPTAHQDVECPDATRVFLDKLNAHQTSPPFGTQQTNIASPPSRETVTPSRRFTKPGLAEHPRSTLPRFSLSTPTATTAVTSTTALRSACQAEERVMRALDDPSPMGFAAERTKVSNIALHMAATVEAGINANTAKTEERAWFLWEQVCTIHGTSPHRTPQDVRENPDRSAHLLSCLLLHAYAVGVPKSKDKTFIKPGSALAYPLAIIRIFARWGITLPNFKFVNAHLAGLKADYIRLHGPQSLAPRRAEPMKFSMVRRMCRISTGTTVAKVEWADSVHIVFIFRRLAIFMIYTAFRIGEICKHTSNELRFITFSCVTWRINGVIYTQPTAELLHLLTPGRDLVFTTPSISKPDQTGEIHCPFPVVFTFEENDCNPARAVRDLELRIGCHLTMAERRVTPLFPNEKHQPYSYATLHNMLKNVLVHCYGNAVAKLYTWHSFRSGLATALHAAGVEDAMIQLICRWMCPESLHIYRRMGIREHERHINRASLTNVDSVQSANLPIIDSDTSYSSLLEESYLQSSSPADTPIAIEPHPTAPAPKHQKMPKPPLSRPGHNNKKKKSGCRKQTRVWVDAVAPVAQRGVASVGHEFPPTLRGYTTFFERPSSRHVPTDRYHCNRENRK